MENNLTERQREHIEQLKRNNSILNVKIKKAVELLLEKNMRVFDIAKQLDLSPENLIIYLNNYSFYEYLFNASAEETYQKVVTKLQEMSTNNNLSLPKLRIDIFSKDVHVQNEYLMLIALTFRIKTDLVSQMFNYPANYIFNNALLTKNIMLISALSKLNSMDNTNQKKAINNLIKFYNTYVDSLKKKDLESIRLLKRKLNDYDAYELMKSDRNSGDKISDQDIVVMINYRIKYFLANKQVASLFKVNCYNMVSRMYEYLEDKEELKQQFMAISDDYSDYFLTHGNGRQ